MRRLWFMLLALLLAGAAQAYEIRDDTGFVTTFDTPPARVVSVLPSLTESESFGMTLAEALACGCPVVGSDAERAREERAAAIGEAQREPPVEAHAVDPGSDGDFSVGREGVHATGLPPAMSARTQARTVSG